MSKNGYYYLIVKESDGEPTEMGFNLYVYNGHGIVDSYWKRDCEFEASNFNDDDDDLHEDVMMNYGNGMTKEVDVQEMQDLVDELNINFDAKAAYINAQKTWEEYYTD